MLTATRVIADLYRDSVSLMRISAALSDMAGISQASVVMATPANLDLLREAGLLDGAVSAGPNEVLIAVGGTDQAALDKALTAGEALLRHRPDAPTGAATTEPARSIEMGLNRLVDANLALIATPGPYAAAEAAKALNLGLNVMIFSDNVTIDDEVALKARAARDGLMVMGPDCGSAVIDGVPLGFANVVARGPVGVIAASGTGLQQVICLLDGAGIGISQAIGTGGRDLDGRVGAITTLRAIRALGDDPDTEVITLIAKPPAPEIAEIVLAAAANTGKPVVACLFAAAAPADPLANVHFATTLVEAAAMAASLARGDDTGGTVNDGVEMAVPDLDGARRHLRALYSGGTFCYEAIGLLSGRLDPLHSNVGGAGVDVLGDIWHSRDHTVLDLGDDAFTRGRPHPMIDHRLRNERLVAEAADPTTAVVLVDVVLGHGAHADPGAAMAPALAAAAANGVIVVGFVCGSQGDPQGLARQVAALQAAGVVMAPDNAAAVRLAAKIVEQTK